MNSNSPNHLSEFKEGSLRKLFSCDNKIFSYYPADKISCCRNQILVRVCGNNQNLFREKKMENMELLWSPERSYF